MVPPIVLNKPTRVFSRLPFTGEHKTSSPVCCDLSRVASIVAASPLPANLMDTSPANGRLNVTSHEVLKSNQAKLLYQARDLAISSNSYAANMEETANSVESGAAAPTLKRRLSSDSNKRTKLMRLDSNEYCNSDSNSALNQTGNLTSSVMAENAKLKRVNELLMKKVSTYKMIMQSEENYQIAVQKIRELMGQNSCGPQ